MSSSRSIPTADRISALPDTLICHILSFLPTKFAIATSVLSKRWTPLWQSLLTLDFDDESFADFASFRHFVYSVIISRDIKLPIQSFRIKCGKPNFDSRDVNRFVQAAVQRGGVQNLDINVLDNEESRETNETLPGILKVLSCKTVVVLKLKYLTFDDVPQSVYLPLLNTLHLDSTDFLGHWGHFINLLRGCLVLEDFHTNNVEIYELCDDMDVETEFDGFSELVGAKFSDPRQNFPFAWLHNAKFLHAEVGWIYEFRVPTFHNLTHMELIFTTGSAYEVEKWKWKWKWVIQLLQHCPKLQNLIIEPSCYGRPTTDIDWNDPETVPECLSHQLRTCSLRGFYGIGCGLQFVEYTLLNSKLLRTMTIKSHYCVGVHETHQMLVKLLSYPRGSVMCRLLFD